MSSLRTFVHAALLLVGAAAALVVLLAFVSPDAEAAIAYRGDPNFGACSAAAPCNAEADGDVTLTPLGATQAGDVMVAFISYEIDTGAEPFIHAPAGWARLTDAPAGLTRTIQEENQKNTLASNSAVGLDTYWKVRVAGETNYNFIVSRSSTNPVPDEPALLISGVVLSFGNVDTLNPIAPANAGTGTAGLSYRYNDHNDDQDDILTHASISPTVANNLQVVFGIVYHVNNCGGSWPAPLVNIGANYCPAGSGANLSMRVARRENAPAGATGTRDWDSGSSNTRRVTIHLALQEQTVGFAAVASGGSATLRVSESAGANLPEVYLNGVSAGAVTVQYEVASALSPPLTPFNIVTGTTVCPVQSTPLAEAATVDAVMMSTTGTLTFGAGQTTRPIPITLCNEATNENSEEAFSVTLSGPVNAVLGPFPSIVVQVQDNDYQLRVTPTGSSTVAEGNAGATTLTYTLDRVNPDGTVIAATERPAPMTVQVRTVDGSATAAGNDYVSIPTAPARTLRFEFADFRYTDVGAFAAGSVLDASHADLGATVFSSPPLLRVDRAPFGTVDTNDDIYADMDASGAVSRGDIRYHDVTQGGATYFALSRVASSDTDVAVAVSNAVLVGRISGGSMPVDGDDGVYADIDASLTISVGDFRYLLVNFGTIYPAGSTVAAGNLDLGISFNNAPTIRRVDRGPAGVDLSDDLYADIDLSRTVTTADRRLTGFSTFLADTLVAFNDPDVGLAFAAGGILRIPQAPAGLDSLDDYYADYNGDGAINAVEISKTLAVQVLGDTAPEADEWFSAEFLNPQNTRWYDPSDSDNGLTTGSLSRTLIIDDEEAFVSIAADMTVTEGNSGTVVVTTTVSVPSATGGAIEIPFRTTGGTATPGMFNSCSFVTGPDYRNRSHPGPDTTWDDIYVDSDLSGGVSVGDLRFTPVTIGIASYGTGSVVAAGDLDIGIALSGGVQYIRVDLPVDGTGAAGISTTDDLYIDWDGSGSVTTGDTRRTAASGFNVGTNVQDGEADRNGLLRVDQAPAGLGPEDNIYMDSGAGIGGTVSVGDYRFTAVGVFAAGTTVASGDADIGATTSNAIRMVWRNQGAATRGLEDAIYADLAGSNLVSPGDYRFTAAGAYTADSTVAAGDTDVDIPAIFVDRPFVVTIGAGQTSNTIVFNICSETVYEADETFQVILDLTGFPCGGGACDGTQVITIRNDDLPPVLSVANVAANEDTGSLTFTVTRTGATEIASTVTATIAPVTATSGSDFTLPAPVTLNFPPGTSTQNVAVTLLADALHENDETLTLTLSNPTEATLGTSVGTGTISNDDAAPTLTLADGSALEADQGSVLLPLTLTLSAPSGLATTVTYATTSGTATTSLDFAATTATATFPAGQTSLTLYLPIYPDTLDEGNPGNEAFTVTLSSPVNAGITDGTATATILDDDVALLRPLDRDAIEGDAGTTTFDLYATLTKPYHQDLTITYALADASATQPADYQVPSTPHTLLIPAQTSVVALPITLQGDTLDEGAGEAFTFTLTGNDRGLGYFAGDDAATGTILDDDGEPTVAITLPTLTEDAGGVQQIRFDLVGVSGGAPSFAYTLTDGNAVRSDYADPCTTNDYCAAVSGTVTFTTTPQFVDLTVRDDARDEFDETFTLTLGSPSSLTLGQTTFTLRIRDNDLPVLTYAVLDDTASESPAGTPVTLRVTRATDDATEPLWVRYSLTGNLLDVVDPAPLVIPAGSTQADLTVAAVNDALDEADPELTTFTLLASADYSSSGLLPADLLVADDDALPTASFTESASSGSLARTTIPITVALNTPSGRSVTVPLEAAPGTTAVEGAGNDYTLSSTALSYAGGETRKTTTLTILPTATAGRILVLRYEAAGLAAGFAQAGSPATFTYTITGNNVPVAENDFFLVSKTLPTALNVLQNDRDADGETLTLDAPSLVTSGVPASMGTVAIVNGQLTFTPAATPTGSGTFTYKASDGTALGNAGSVTLLLLEDRDGDGRPDVSDNCPGAVNANQADDDGDGLGNVCDAALQDGPQGDLDGDGKKNFEDNCRNAANASQLDSDGDGLGDACDAVAYPDSDGDGAGDPVDNCLGTPNDNQADLDADGAGDVCDEDRDGDGSLNGVDGFPDDADELADSDRDGLGDNGDNCPGASNAAQSDADGDDVGDVCDGDRDGDGVANAADDFPEDATRTLDSDSDGLDDGSDNCPNAANVNQANGDGDSDGDACDGDPEDGPLGDADGDGVANNEDAFPTRRSESRDADDDGEGDNEDTDDDNDSLLDDEEEEAGTDSENPDTDGDELRDDLEVEGGFDPLDARSPDYGVASVAVETDGRGNVVVRFESSGDERVDEYRVWRASTPTLVGRVPHAEGVTDYSFTDNGYPAGEEHAYYVEAVLSAASPVSFAPALSESSGVVEFTVCEVQVADTDGDGLCNAQEVLLGTNSENADSDGDGLADGVEVDEGSDPLHVELDEADVGPASNGVKAWVWWALGGLGAAAILLVGVIVVGPRLRRP